MYHLPKIENINTVSHKLRYNMETSLVLYHLKHSHAHVDKLYPEVISMHIIYYLKQRSNLNLRFKAVQRGLEWGYDFF